MKFNSILYGFQVDAVLRQDIKWSKYKKVPMLLARNKDGKYVQLTDSSMIVSVLSSFLIDPSVDISELVKLYPSVSYMNDDGKKIHDILNKYHLIYGDKIPKNKSKDDLEYALDNLMDNLFIIYLQNSKFN